MQKTIVIDLHIIDTFPSQPTNAIDYITLGWLCFFFLQMIVLSILLLVFRKHILLSTKNISTLLALAFAGIIHSSSSFISNEQLEDLRFLNYLDCSLWVFIGQYLFGLNIWFLCIFYRIITYGFIFETRWEMSTMNKRKWKILIGLLLSIPILTLCITGTYMQGSMLDPELNSCNLQVIWRIFIICWILLELIGLFIVAMFLLRKISNKFFNETDAIKQIVIVGMCILVINGLLSFGEWVSFPWGRSLYTFLVSLLYIFSFYRLIGYSLFKVIRKDVNYTDDFTLYIYPGPDLSRIKTIYQIQNHAECWSNFLSFCESKTRFPQHMHSPNYFMDGKPCLPMYVVKCITNLCTYRDYFHSRGDLNNKTMYNAIVKTFCEKGVPGYLNLAEGYVARPLQEKSPQKDSLNSLYNVVLNILSQSFVSDYLDDENGFNDYFKEELTKAKILDNLSEEKMIHGTEYRKLKTSYLFENRTGPEEQVQAEIDIDKSLEMAEIQIQKLSSQLNSQLNTQPNSNLLKKK
jgi:hypothetical protein